MSAPVDHIAPASVVDTAGEHFKTALAVARKESLTEDDATNPMPGGGGAKPAVAADGEKERTLARIYAGMFDERTLKEKLAWVNSRAYGAYMKRLPSVQMKCVMSVTGKLK